MVYAKVPVHTFCICSLGQGNHETRLKKPKIPSFVTLYVFLYHFIHNLIVVGPTNLRFGMNNISNTK